MSRVYFNGVSQISYNGRMISFVLDDTYKKGMSDPTKNQVIELISELEAAEGVCRYLLNEIEKIKSLTLNEEPSPRTGEVVQNSSGETALKLGPRLSKIGFEHS